jgi:N-acetylmuramoyl-L-alanine amidase
MARKNIALETSLVVAVLIAAFVLQSVISQTKPPVLPESARAAAVVTLAEDQEEMVLDAEVEEKPSLKIPAEYDPHLADLGQEPDWLQLDDYQYTVEKEDFMRLLTEVYTVGDYWEKWFAFEEEHVVIRTHASDLERTYRLAFKNEIVEKQPEPYWRGRDQLSERTENSPLLGLKIAIDPGHIGGNYAEIELRRFVLTEGAPPVQEGNMTLTVATQLVEQLEALGASVTLLRVENEPVNPFLPDDYLSYAKSKLETKKAVITEATLKREAAKLFYRNGEIRARALLVNEQIQPDLVLCIHFNAGPQPNPEKPILLDDEHFHMILNGAYTKSEVAHDDERFRMVLKMVQGVHEEEVGLAKSAALSFAAETELPAYQYSPDSSRAVNVAEDPYLWARNLLANRLYDCPVLFYEPYLMNGKDSYVRMQVGDYNGLRYVNQKLQPSIYAEYVSAVTKGLVDYYTAKPVTEALEQEVAFETDQDEIQ